MGGGADTGAVRGDRWAVRTCAGEGDHVGLLVEPGGRGPLGGSHLNPGGGGCPAGPLVEPKGRADAGPAGAHFGGATPVPGRGRVPPL
ncbi:hypothetical protein GCM10010249_44560 [Streptomyces roseolilacinus]|uniref:Uncharacterized protein n=1 Tax=Streptomyces roseolilacinus TaxID=66904 RepID=A0A918B2Y1_9ACTN|nr:hypothetical protein GCM10010249_44560 [Streptomyces roseolilacinus]